MKKKLKEQYETDGSIPKKEPPHVDDIFSVLDGLDKQKVTNYVIKQVLKHKVPMLTFWKQGLIYKVALPYEWWERYFLVAKKKKDTFDDSYDLRSEFRLHQTVYESIDHPRVKVPELFGYQELPNREQYIVMEFVPGQTLYTLLLNKVTGKNKPERPMAQNDREADTNIVRIFGVEKAKNMLWKIEVGPYIYQNTRGMKLFTKQQADTMKKDIREFLSQMHEKWIYHRDLWGSLRNIMICPDGKIYIIDFWKAIRKEGVTDEKEIYGHDQYYSDEEILDIIDAYTEED